MTTRGRTRKRQHPSSSQQADNGKLTTTTPRNPNKGANKKKLSSLSRMMKHLSVSHTTMQATAVLIVAIVTSLLWNYLEHHDAKMLLMQKQNDVDPRIERFLHRVCRSQEDGEHNHDYYAYCHPSLVPHRRTQRAVRDIPTGTPVVTIPRALQLWDLDALRHDWIQQYAVGARHARTGNPVDAAAYLAIYLVLLAQGNIQLSKNATNRFHNEEVLVEYLTSCMPTHDELAAFHPLLWDEQELLEQLRPHSATFAVVRAYRDMIASEYQAFVHAYQLNRDDEHAAHDTNNVVKNLDAWLSEREYERFRILVLSRSFGTGPLPSTYYDQERAMAGFKDWTEEYQYYRIEMGIDLRRGSYVTIPILDFYDHHARPNVEYSFQPNHNDKGEHSEPNNNNKGAFVITSLGIPAGSEIVDTYGKYTDAHLFAKFGFVNGDGSGYAQANLAVWHRILDMDLQQQFSYLPFSSSMKLSEGMRKGVEKQAQVMFRYLQFDDGYQDCIAENNSHDSSDAVRFKQLKLEHLKKIANSPKRWNIVLRPRAPEAVPALASNLASTLDPPQLSMKQRHASQLFHAQEYRLVAATCRLISLTHHDMNGNAAQFLQDNLANRTFVVEPQLQEDQGPNSLASALEFRTHFCLARLASTALVRYDASIPDEENIVARLNRESFQTKEWTAAHLRLGEMHSLDALRIVSFAAAREWEAQRNTSPQFTIRDVPCPLSINDNKDSQSTGSDSNPTNRNNQE